MMTRERHAENAARLARPSTPNEQRE